MTLFIIAMLLPLGVGVLLARVFRGRTALIIWGVLSLVSLAPAWLLSTASPHQGLSSEAANIFSFAGYFGVAVFLVISAVTLAGIGLGTVLKNMSREEFAQ